MSTISPNLRLTGVSQTRPSSAPTPTRTGPAEALPQDGFQASATATPQPTAPAREAAPSWTQSMVSRLGTWATMLIPTPVSVAVSAVSDVITGATRESHFEYKKECPTEAAAQESFEAAKERLFNPNGWRELGPGMLSAKFELISPDTKKPKQGAPAEGDFLRIKLPDPGPPVWVRIEEIKDTPDLARVVVRPSENPTDNNPGTIIHLFGEETTNVFELKREGKSVSGSVSGKDEVPNMTGNLFQNVFAGARLAGAWMGAKKPQWDSFTHKLVEGPPKTTGWQLQSQVTGMAAYLGLMQPTKPPS